jgi:hypothetical protein
MKHHEREFFISMIRCGKVFINKHDIELEVRPLTVEQLFKSCQVYQKAYDNAYSEEIMTEDDMNQWMFENELWTPHDDKREEGLKKEIERLKIEIYNARNDTKLANNIRLYIRAGESQLSSHLNKKYVYHQNTCEGVASTERLSWIIKNTTFCNNELYDFGTISMQYVIDEWQSTFLSESKSRELARTEPWKSLWVTRENTGHSLFCNPPNTELTYNQKNLLIWSQMYDNIQESLECPNKDVIEDDDMLDGWFIIQGQKREKERTEKEFEAETKNEKIKNASEVFIVSNNDHKNSKINSMNSPISSMIKKQREAFVNKHGHVEEQNLPDQKMNLQMMATNKLRGKLGG